MKRTQIVPNGHVPGLPGVATERGRLANANQRFVEQLLRLASLQPASEMPARFHEVAHIGERFDGAVDIDRDPEELDRCDSSGRAAARGVPY